ncbi:MAG: FemAB family XrtA/PEP-CTERM system-associated protein [Gammaproteobacteria bacterium]
MITLVDEPGASDWDHFVDDTPDASAYHRYGWRRVIRSVFGHETFYFAARSAAGGMVGVLPLVRLRSVMFGDFLVSLPYFNYGGALAQSADVRTRLLDAATDFARRLRVSHLELRHRCAEPEGWPVRTDKVSMLLRLPETPEQLWKNLTSKLRAQIKRPLREGAACAFGRAELLDEFYGVFAENMRDLGTPVYPQSFFRAMLAELPEATALAVVRLGGRAVAAAFMLRHRHTMEIPWAASLRRTNSLGVNVHLYWKLLEHATASRLAVFDFGRSSRDSGAYRFKRQWGAQPEQLYWHYWLRDGKTVPGLSPANPKYRAAIAAWRRLPLPVANWLGPRIVKNLP